MKQSDNDSMDDFFAKRKRQDEEFGRIVSACDVRDIFGVVGPSGAGGLKADDSDDWFLVVHFDGWRLGNGPMQRGKLRLEMPVGGREKLSSHFSEIGGYDVLHVKGRVAEHSAGHMQALVEEIVGTVTDTELEAHARELQKPVVISDPRFGVFTLDDLRFFFTGECTWNGETVGLNLESDSSLSIDEHLKVAAVLWDAELEWNARILEYAVEDLLDTKNEHWLKEGEAEISAEEFKDRLSLESIVVYPNGRFEFWYDDGDMFWGHEVSVRGSLTRGLIEATIHG